MSLKSELTTQLSAAGFTVYDGFETLDTVKIGSSKYAVISPPDTQIKSECTKLDGSYVRLLRTKLTALLFAESNKSAEGLIQAAERFVSGFELSDEFSGAELNMGKTKNSPLNKKICCEIDITAYVTEVQQ